MNRFKKLILTGTLILGSIGLGGVASAAPDTVSDNDTMWIISQQYVISLLSLIQANTEVINPNIIWKDMVPNIPISGSGSPSDSPSDSSSNSPSMSQSTYASEVINLVNQERANVGLPTLTSDSSLSAMALDKAKDMYNNNYFDHTSPTYGSPFDMMKTYGIGFSYAGENIAMGQRTPQEVMTSWMNSAGHRENILNANFTKIGVAYYNGEWVQEFIAN